MIAANFTQPEIAAKLGIKPGTVKIHAHFGRIKLETKTWKG
jgi:DNA-directed RNA polymerase specialized sigma24 family protein